MDGNARLCVDFQKKMKILPIYDETNQVRTLNHLKCIKRGKVKSVYDYAFNLTEPSFRKKQTIAICSQYGLVLQMKDNQIIVSPWIDHEYSFQNLFFSFRNATIRESFTSKGKRSFI